MPTHPPSHEAASLRRPTSRLALARAGAGAALAVALAVSACAPDATPGPSFAPGAIILTAQNLAFDRDELFLPAEKAFPFVLVNNDVDQHNIAIRTQRGFEGDLLFRTDPIGTFSAEVSAGPFAEGTYFFLCELHPVMSGTVIVQ